MAMLAAGADLIGEWRTEYGRLARSSSPSRARSHVVTCRSLTLIHHHQKLLGANEQISPLIPKEAQTRIKNTGASGAGISVS